MKRVSHSGFIHSFSNLLAFEGQLQVLDAYPSMLGMPAVTFRELLDSKHTDEIPWVLIFRDAESAARARACGVDKNYLPLSHSLVQQAFDTYAELLPFLAALAILDEKTVCSNQILSADLRNMLRANPKIPVPLLPSDVGSQERCVLCVTLGKGIIVQPGQTLSTEQTARLAERPHGLEPIVGSAKFSQAWTTYLYNKDIFKLRRDGKACSLFPGCDGVDEYGLPECDKDLAAMILGGSFELSFSEGELENAKNSFAGNCNCSELRTKICESRREVRRCSGGMPANLLSNVRRFLSQMVVSEPYDPPRDDFEGSTPAAAADTSPGFPCPTTPQFCLDWRLAHGAPVGSGSEKKLGPVLVSAQLASGIALHFLPFSSFRCK
jgi:hypothetical protein